MDKLLSIAQNAKEAFYDTMNLGITKKNEIIKEISKLLIENCDIIISANNEDIKNAKENGISSVMVDRLMLNEDRIKSIANAALKVTNLVDPIGSVEDGYCRPNGLFIKKVRVPIGVVGIIYESRPNVTVDAAILTIKTSNVAILKGGKEAINTNIALMNCIRQALINQNVNPNAVTLIEDNARETILRFMKMRDYVDVLIPRGGQNLINSVIQNSLIPVIETGAGNCHVYVDEFADLDMAVNIIFNAKTDRVTVCNACETVLVHESIKDRFLPMLYKKLSEKNVIFKGCNVCKSILKDNCIEATDEDYSKEFLDYVIACKVVNNIECGIKHINHYSTKHSEAIITSDMNNAKLFTDKILSAVVYVNASTRFTDGEEFGFGAEIGISTQKLHARGPMGLKELTTTKYIVEGNGQIK